MNFLRDLLHPSQAETDNGQRESVKPEFVDNTVGTATQQLGETVAKELTTAGLNHKPNQVISPHVQTPAGRVPPQPQYDTTNTVAERSYQADVVGQKTSGPPKILFTIGGAATQVHETLKHEAAHFTDPDALTTGVHVGLTGTGLKLLNGKLKKIAGEGGIVSKK